MEGKYAERREPQRRGGKGVRRTLGKQPDIGLAITPYSETEIGLEFQHAPQTPKFKRIELKLIRRSKTSPFRR